MPKTPTITELRKKVKSARAKYQAIYDETKEDQNPQTREIHLRAEGILEVFTAMDKALHGDMVFLNILAETHS